MSKKIVIVVLCVCAMLLVGCSQAASSNEARKNLIEAYLINRSSGNDTAAEPNIYGLDDAAKRDIVNQLSFDIVDGKEQVLIDYLDRQWPQWQSSEGFIISYLTQNKVQRDKAKSGKPNK